MEGAFHLLLESEEAALPGVSWGWGPCLPTAHGGCSPGDEVGVICRFRPGALGLGCSSLALIILDGGHPISRCFGESLLRDH